MKKFFIRFFQKYYLFLFLLAVAIFLLAQDFDYSVAQSIRAEEVLAQKQSELLKHPPAIPTKEAPALPKENFPYSIEKPLNFLLSDYGLVDTSNASIQLGEPIPSPLAPKVNSIIAGTLSANPNEQVFSNNYFALAINQFGTSFIRFSRDNSHYQIYSRILPEALSGLSLTGIWKDPNGDSFILQFYQDPFVARMQESQNDSATNSEVTQNKKLVNTAELMTIKLDGVTEHLPDLASTTSIDRWQALRHPREKLFSLYHPNQNQWYFQMREENSDNTALLRFFKQDNLQGDNLKEVSKDDLQNALYPSFSNDGAPASLQTAIRALGRKHLLIALRSELDYQRYWLTDGELEDANPASAWMSGDESYTVLIAGDGTGVIARQDESIAFKLTAPIKNCEYTSPGALKITDQNGKERFLIFAAWDHSQFPTIDAAGLSFTSVVLENFTATPAPAKPVTVKKVTAKPSKKSKKARR